jgi:hypothetical protein
MALRHLTYVRCSEVPVDYYLAVVIVVQGREFVVVGHVVVGIHLAVV